MDSPSKIWTKNVVTGRLSREEGSDVAPQQPSPSKKKCSRSSSLGGASKDSLKPSYHVVGQIAKNALAFEFEDPESHLYQMAATLAKEFPQLLVYAAQQPSILVQTIMQCKTEFSTGDAIRLGAYFLPTHDGASALATTETWRNLHTHPAALDVRTPLDWQSLLPRGWKVIEPLGHGRTSIVHLVGGEQGKYAVKVARQGHVLDEDLKYLNQLVGIEGIPNVHLVLSASVLVLQPVGKPFTRSIMEELGSLLRLGDLVDILECAHRRGILNRDVRQENIMVAESISNGRLRLFILDWGFAAYAGTVCSFSGSLTTASDSILEQHLGQCKEKCNYTFADDLVSLVRCVFLFFNGRAASNIHNLSRDCVSLLQFWESVMKKEFWARAQGLALKLDYTELKKSLQCLQDLVRE